MTDEEKFEMYMKIPHEELVKMKIEEEKVLECLENRLKEFDKGYYVDENYNLTCKDFIDSNNNKIKIYTNFTNTNSTNTFEKDDTNTLLDRINKLESRVKRLENKHVAYGGSKVIIGGKTINKKK